MFEVQSMQMGLPYRFSSLPYPVQNVTFFQPGSNKWCRNEDLGILQWPPCTGEVLHPRWPSRRRKHRFVPFHKAPSILTSIVILRVCLNLANGVTNFNHWLQAWKCTNGNANHLKDTVSLVLNPFITQFSAPSTWPAKEFHHFILQLRRSWKRSFNDRALRTWDRWVSSLQVAKHYISWWDYSSNC